MGISYNGIFKIILKFTFFFLPLTLYYFIQSQAFLALVILSAWKALSYLLHRSLRPTVKTGCRAKPSPAQMKESSHMLCPVIQGVFYNTVCLTLLDSKILTPPPTTTSTTTLRWRWGRCILPELLSSLNPSVGVVGTVDSSYSCSQELTLSKKVLVFVKLMIFSMVPFCYPKQSQRAHIYPEA